MHINMNKIDHRKLETNMEHDNEQAAANENNSHSLALKQSAQPERQSSADRTPNRTHAFHLWLFNA